MKSNNLKFFEVLIFNVNLKIQQLHSIQSQEKVSKQISQVYDNFVLKVHTPWVIRG